MYKARLPGLYFLFLHRKSTGNGNSRYTHFKEHNFLNFRAHNNKKFLFNGNLYSTVVSLVLSKSAV